MCAEIEYSFGLVSGQDYYGPDLALRRWRINAGRGAGSATIHSSSDMNWFEMCRLKTNKNEMETVRGGHYTSVSLPVLYQSAKTD